MADNPISMSPEKAKQILRDGEIGGKPLTEKQRGMFGLIAGGGKLTRMQRIEAEMESGSKPKLTDSERKYMEAVASNAKPPTIHKSGERNRVEQKAKYHKK